MWRWRTTRGGIFWRVVSPRGSRPSACMSISLPSSSLFFTCQGNPPAIRRLPQRIHRLAKGSTDRCVVAGYECYDAQSYPTRPHHKRFLDPRTRLRSNVSFWRTLVSPVPLSDGSPVRSRASPDLSWPCPTSLSLQSALRSPHAHGAYKQYNTEIRKIKGGSRIYSYISLSRSYQGRQVISSVRSGYC